MVYRPIFSALRREGVRLVAVCDPVREHADAYADSLGVPAYYSISELVRARPMEAALVVAPAAAHYAVSYYLSSHGIHNVVETPLAVTLAQAQEMARMARQNDVVMRVGEQFFRLPFPRLAQRAAATGYLGPINRVICAYDHAGSHNNSCWIHFFRAYPIAVQAMDQNIPEDSVAYRFRDIERFRSHFYTFPGNLFAADFFSDVKGLLGRYPRPGYTQIEGERGAIAWRAASRWN